MMISFRGRHFEKTIILMSVRWYVAYSLSYRNIEELLKERGISIDHATINRWVIKYAPLLEKEFRKKHKQVTGFSWRMDETYVKNKGKHAYLYRAVDKQGKTIDFMLSAKRFFRKMLSNTHVTKPRVISVDKNPAYPIAFKELKSQGTIPKSTKFRPVFLYCLLFYL